MIVGSHNSLSYCATRWWCKPFAKFARCQSLDVYDQYRKGVRFFDIRIRYSKGKIIVCHGLADYKVDLEDVLEYLDEHGVYVRIAYERSNVWRGYEKWCMELTKEYPNIMFMFCVKKPEWRVIYNWFDKDLVEMQHSPSNIKEALRTPFGLLDKQRRKAKKYLKKCSDKIVLFDFVEEYYNKYQSYER